MTLLYFQVPDTQARGFGNQRLSLLGDTRAYGELCGLLGLKSNAKLEDAYAALSAFQRTHGLIADGMAGPYNLALLRNARLKSKGPAAASWLARLPPERLAKIFPYTLRKNLQVYAPYVFAALDAAGYTANSAHGRLMCKLALALVRVECEGFEPISEVSSRHNTAPGGTPFGLYEAPGTPAKQLGNTQAGDGATFKGRGLVQLTGRANYASVGTHIGLPLERLPHLANLPECAAAVLVGLLQRQQARVLAAMKARRYAAARKLVNGATHGLERFKDACAKFDAVDAAASAGKAGGSSPRGFNFARFTESKTRFALPVKRDRVDLRDLPYRPPLGSLPAEYPPAHIVRDYWKRYRALVLDQGEEGACTGFGLACVINYLQFSRRVADHEAASAARDTFSTAKLEKASPRMLYELARRYDEFAGDDYEGSSCRGALKGWHKHGVCSESDWPYLAPVPVNPRWTRAALDVTLGVYYRIDRKNLVDMQAAIADVGAVYVSAEVHAGWNPAALRAQKAAMPSHAGLPRIAFTRGKTRTSGAHAFALVGYNRDGFIVQNSWGADWGLAGFAVLHYEDWLENGMDAWAATLGVPGVVNNAAAIPAGDGAARQAGQTGILAGGSAALPADLALRHTLVLDRGMPCKSSTGDVMQEQSLGEIGTAWPLEQFQAWRASHPDEPARLVLYAHGGLNSEDEAITRAREMAAPFIDNRIYPIFIAWKTGPLESLKNLLKGRGAPEEQIAGNVFSDNVSDPALENTIGPTAARALWNEMKHAARVANTPDGGLTQLANALQSLLIQIPELEIHLIGHSAGSLLLGPMVANLLKRRLPIGTAHLYAPACTVAFANEHWLPHVGDPASGGGRFPLYVSVLSDQRERDDNVIAIYRKSLLYFVARGIEEERPAPLLGMEGAWDRAKLFERWSGDAATLQALSDFDRARETCGDALVLNVLDAARVACQTDAQGRPDLEKTVAAAHGAFDGDAPLVLQTLQLMRGSDGLARKNLDLSDVP